MKQPRENVSGLDICSITKRECKAAKGTWAKDAAGAGDAAAAKPAPAAATPPPATK